MIQRQPQALTPSPTPSRGPQEDVQIPKTQVAALQEVVSKITNYDIPSITSSISAVKVDLATIKAECSGYGSRFDSIDKHFMDLKNFLMPARPLTGSEPNQLPSAHPHLDNSSLFPQEFDPESMINPLDTPTRNWTGNMNNDDEY